MSVSLRTAFLVMAFCVFSPQRALPSACSWGMRALLCSAGWDASASREAAPRLWTDIRAAAWTLP